MSTETPAKMPPPSLKIKGVPQSAATIDDLMGALRGYVGARLRSDYFAQLNRAETEKALQLREAVFTILSVMERQPSAQVAFAMRTSTYNNPIQVKISSYYLPDQYYPTLIEAINEELLDIDACKDLINMEGVEQAKEEEASLHRLLTLLKNLGVNVGDDYLQNLKVG